MECRVKFVHLDVTSFESQAVFLREALELFPRNEVDVFIPNAGTLSMPTQVNPSDPAELVGMKTAPKDLSTRVLVSSSACSQAQWLVVRAGLRQ